MAPRWSLSASSVKVMVTYLNKEKKVKEKEKKVKDKDKETDKKVNDDENDDKTNRSKWAMVNND